MPTVASQPSLRQTQAIGAILMHQFARDRFLQAGISEELIREAENIENLNELTGILLEDTSIQHHDRLETSINDNYSSEEQTSYNLSTIVNAPQSTTDGESISELTTTTYPNTSRNETTTSGARFLSMAESSNGHIENTMYHSMNVTRDQRNGSLSSSNLDRSETIEISSSYGAELRRIALEFDRTQLRLDIKARADKISLNDINRETFTTLLDELFEGGITRVKIVTLFFFCTDVALRAAAYTQGLAVKFTSWSFSYIINKVCMKIHELGGWDQVLFVQLKSLLLAGGVLLSYLFLGLMLRKSITRS